MCVHIFYHILPEFSGCSAATNQWGTTWQVHPANLDRPCMPWISGPDGAMSGRPGAQKLEMVTGWLLLTPKQIEKVQVTPFMILHFLIISDYNML